MSRFGRTVSVQSLKNQALIADKCFVAERFFDRLKGLIGRSELNEGLGMLFPKCNSIVMWFMSIPLDVVFVRRERTSDGENRWRVTSTKSGIRPWRPLPLQDGQASDTLELPMGTIDRCDIRAGDE